METKVLRKTWALVMAVMVAMATLNCSRPEKFKIMGEIADGATTNLYVKYYGNNAVQTAVTAARDGKFDAELASVDPTIVEILDNEYRVLARLLLKDGDVVKVVIDRQNPYNNKVTGSEINQQWCELQNANAELLASGDRARINEFLDEYISANHDNILSTLMFASFYDWGADPLHADSVASLIDPDLRLASVMGWYASQIRRFADADSYGKMPTIRYRGLESGSSLTFSPSDHKASLLVLSNESCRRADSIVPQLKDLSKAYKKSALQILDLSLYSDTISWRFSCRRDSATWQQGWLPGGIVAEGVNQLAVTALPYYIVTDSAGVQRYRGTSIPAACDEIKRLIDK